MASKFAVMFQGTAVMFKDIDEDIMKFGRFLNYDKAVGRVRIQLSNPGENDPQFLSVKESLVYESFLGPDAYIAPKPKHEPEAWRRAAALRAWETMRSRNLNMAVTA